ncbi:MAG: tRNA1(Val) (adenine(37)-N6)-methyltransferase [Desulfovibrionaceae bacterium]
MPQTHSLTPPDPARHARQARAFFPRGLAQPQGGFRFAVDALLLASFAACHPDDTVLDCGTGCGVVGLALLLGSRPPARVLGLDADPDMLAAARANAAMLGLADRFAVAGADMRALRGQDAVAPESCDRVVANPPYRSPGRGRVSLAPATVPARFEIQGGMEDFVAAAVYAVRNRGAVHLVHLAERLPDVLAACRAVRLEPKRLRLVHGHAASPARLLLLEARKNGGPGLVVEAPLIMYAGKGAAARLTPEALAFCPFLACNAGPSGSPSDARPDELAVWRDGADTGLGADANASGEAKGNAEA